MSARISMACPHCKSGVKVHDVQKESELRAVYRYRCTDIECGHTFEATLTAVRTVKASAKPSASVQLPLSADIFKAARRSI
ncbi:ogr/Delta-like zinc finger family protein [Burkholderia stagnalis]|uniref:ogr/Delta-like zinc finger family protein n=1 Tax=Burkholderia stagnalis TaxID=1503054 RepID=UPI0009C0EFEF